MSVDYDTFTNEYSEQGYFAVRNYLGQQEIDTLRQLILTFHDKWKRDNAEFYREYAFNSSLITGSEYLSYQERLALFNFISSPKLMALISAVIPNKPVFMNTQLFFNPINPELKDFWHRDCQYDHDVEAQKRIIEQDQVVHLRIPLFDELGMEVIPKSHKRWDNQEEFEVRYELKGRQSNENLPFSHNIPLTPGDVLVFSADMLHRGLYGKDRLALDILVFDSSSTYVDYIDDDCLPEASMLCKIDDPHLFINAFELKKSVKQNHP